MFTGLIEEIGRVQSVIKAAKSSRIMISAKKVLEHVQIGDSICTNGVCLTVTELKGQQFVVDVMAETMRRSNLHQLSVGDSVNLERALRVGDRLGGHIVSGHIDGMGKIVSLKQEDNAVWVTISAEKEILKYMVQKGSVTLDGISLTIANVSEDYFQVSIIPHTKEVTTLLKKKPGEDINIECDMLGKYIEKLMLSKEQAPVNQGITMNFLSENGFL